VGTGNSSFKKIIRVIEKKRLQSTGGEVTAPVNRRKQTKEREKEMRGIAAVAQPNREWGSWAQGGLV